MTEAGTFGSLFAGVGGIDLGLERAGWRCFWQAESDSYARRVLAKHWPAVRRYRDVREVDERAASVDLIAGGFPCQDISSAGGGAGLAGERSGLWSEFARVIGCLAPRFVLVENVARLRSKGLGVVLLDLAELGYDAEWACLRAADVGAPHIRDRLFIVGWRGKQHYKPDGLVRPLADTDKRTGHPETHHDYGEEPQWNDIARRGERIIRQPGRSDHWAIEPNVGRVAHGVPARVDRLRCIGNAVVPQLAEHLGRCLMGAASTPP